MRWMISGSASALLFVASGTAASTYHTQQYRCAVGGERFKAQVQMSMTSFGQRPDGQLYHTGRAPMVECPGNGLVYYKDEFSKTEARQLTPIVAGAEYQALRKTDTAGYRAYWLMSRLGADPSELARALLVASWSSDQDAARKARYQREYVAAVAALRANSEDRLWLRLRAANALRELGEHAPSNALLERLQQEVKLLEDVEQRESGLQLVAGLQALNAEGNRATEPLTLIPDIIAAEYCAKPPRALSASEIARCTSPSIKALVAKR